MIISGILIFYNPDQITDWNSLALFLSIGIILMALNFLTYDYFKLVKVGHQKLMYLDNKDWIEVKWEEIEKIFRVRLASPPIYYAKVKTDKKIIIFPTDSNSNHTEVSGGPFKIIFDNSRMGEIINKAKDAYGR